LVCVWEYKVLTVEYDFYGKDYILSPEEHVVFLVGHVVHDEKHVLFLILVVDAHVNFEVFIMSQDRIPKSDNDFVVWLANFNTVAAANRAALKLTVEELGECEAGHTSMVDSIANFTTAQAAAKAATQAKQDSRSSTEGTVRTFVKRIQADKSVSDELRERLGIAVRDSAPSPINPVPPTNLVVTGLDTGVNQLAWKNNGNKQGTVYHIEAKVGDTGAWSLIDTTTKTKFSHTGQRPGVKVAYRIRAKRGDRGSEFSNEAVVYGM
jgi:hypothetical protein